MSRRRANLRAARRCTDRVQPVDATEPSRDSRTFGVLRAGRLAGVQSIVVSGFRFSGRHESEAMHKALLVVPADLVGGEELHVGEVAQLAAAERRVGPNALVIVGPDPVSATALSKASPMLPMKGRRPDSDSVSPKCTVEY